MEEARSASVRGSSRHVGVSPSSTQNPSPLPRMRSRSSSFFMQLANYTYKYVYIIFVPKRVTIIIKNNGDKLHRGELTRAADEN